MNIKTKRLEINNSDTPRIIWMDGITKTMSEKNLAERDPSGKTEAQRLQTGRQRLMIRTTDGRRTIDCVIRSFLPIYISKTLSLVLREQTRVIKQDKVKIYIVR